MLGALDSGSTDPGSEPWLGYCVVFLGMTLYPHITSLRSTQIYKHISANLTCSELESHPMGIEILLAASCNGISPEQMGHLART